MVRFRLFLGLAVIMQPIGLLFRSREGSEEERKCGCE